MTLLIKKDLKTELYGKRVFLTEIFVTDKVL